MNKWGKSVPGKHTYDNETRMKLVAWSAVLALCIAAILYLALKPLPSLPELPAPPAPSAADSSSSRAEYFDKNVQSVIAQADAANRQAADRCLQRLHDTFDGYRKGIEPFSHDITSWGTRWGVLRRMPSDWWYSQTDVQDFVTKKFEEHLFSEDKLKQGIAGTIKEFSDDVTATNNTLLTKVQASVSASDLPALPDIDDTSFSKDVAKSLQEYSAAAATSSVKNLVLTELITGVGGEAAAQIVVAISARIATTAATTSAAAGGATAGGATVGGGGGTVTGPVGTVVGFGVGLAVGAVIDWWMSSRFEEMLSLQLNGLIDNVESSVTYGAKDQKGLKQSLDETCDALRDAYRQSLYSRIVLEPVE